MKIQFSISHNLKPEQRVADRVHGAVAALASAFSLNRERTTHGIGGWRVFGDGIDGLVTYGIPTVLVTIELSGAKVLLKARIEAYLKTGLANALK